jgi:hypothetical protein
MFNVVNFIGCVDQGERRMLQVERIQNLVLLVIFLTIMHCFILFYEIVSMVFSLLSLDSVHRIEQIDSESLYYNMYLYR